MTLATARPVKITTTKTRSMGQVVMAPDQWHNGALRPHVIVGRRGTDYHVVPLSHTPQGQFCSERLGGGTYIAAFNKFNGSWNGFFIQGALLMTYQRQFGSDTAAALAEVKRQHTERR
jgi:hypothetical protein